MGGWSPLLSKRKAFILSNQSSLPLTLEASLKAAALHLKSFTSNLAHHLHPCHRKSVQPQQWHQLHGTELKLSKEQPGIGKPTLHHWRWGHWASVGALQLCHHCRMGPKLVASPFSQNRKQPTHCGWVIGRRKVLYTLKLLMMLHCVCDEYTTRLETGKKWFWWSVTWVFGVSPSEKRRKAVSCHNIKWSTHLRTPASC